jgi:MFS family permease
MRETKWQNGKTYIAVFYVSFVMLFFQYSNIATADCAKAYPNVSQALISLAFSLPALISLPIQLIVGGLSTRLSKRMICMSGMAVFAVANGFAWLIPGSFGWLMFTRVLAGIGLGIIQPFPPSLPVEFYWNTGKVSKYIGFQNFIQSFGGVIASYLIGILVQMISWRWAFSTAVFCVIGVWAFSYLPKKADWPEPPPRDPSFPANGKKAKLPGIFWVFAVLVILYEMCYTCLNQGFTFQLEQAGLGSSALSGTMFSILCICSLVTSLVYSNFEKIFHKWAIPVSFLIFSAGMVVISIAHSIAVFYTGIVLVGIAQGWYMPATFGSMNRLAGAASTLASSILGVCMGIGLFTISVVLLPLTKALTGGGLGYDAMHVTSYILAVLVVLYFIATKFISQKQLNLAGGSNGPAKEDVPVEAKK